MSKQLTLSAVLSVVLMAGFAVFGPHLSADQTSSAQPQQRTAAATLQLPSVVVALTR